VLLFINNVLDNPSEPKFRTIKVAGTLRLSSPFVEDMVESEGAREKQVEEWKRGRGRGSRKIERGFVEKRGREGETRECVAV